MCESLRDRSNYLKHGLHELHGITSDFQIVNYLELGWLRCDARIGRGVPSEIYIYGRICRSFNATYFGNI